MRPHLPLGHLAPLLMLTTTALAVEPDWKRLEAAPTPLAALTEAATWTSDEPSIANRLVQEIAVLHAEAGEPSRALSVFPFGPGGVAPTPVEALRESGAELQARGHPVARTGNYTREPVFAELLREAIRLGWTIVDYEARDSDGMEAREAGQAQRLWERTVGTDPDARVLVHAGYAHVDLTRGRLFDVLPLAARIQARAPGAVISIDQVDLRPDPAGRERPHYRPLRARFPSDHAQLCRTAGAIFALEPARNTASVLLPDGDPRERPAWLSLEGHRHALAAPALCSAIVPCLIEAHATDDPDDAVAADRCVVRDTDRCVLFLRPGAYRLRGSDATGRFLGKTTIRLAPRD